MWIWGVIGGAILVALIIGGVFYDRASRRRCPSCQAIIPKSATTCPHCTGELKEYLEKSKESKAPPGKGQD